MALYPYILKLFIAPMADNYYIRRLGRSKAYILLACTSIVSIFTYLYVSVDSMIENNRISLVAVLGAIVAASVAIMKISFQSWQVLMFDEEKRAKAATFESLGLIAGMTLCFNLFLPLNDAEWLNDNLFDGAVYDRPLITHAELCAGVVI